MNKEQFAEKIRTTHPQYSSVDNETLITKIVDKYPTYASQITDLKPKTSFLSNIKSQFLEGGEKALQGFETVKQGAQSKSVLGGAQDIVRGAIGMASGGIQTVFSPLTAGVQKVAETKPVTTALKATQEKAINPIADVISKSPALQKFAMENPNSEEVISDLINIVGTVTGGNQAKSLASGASTKVKNIVGQTTDTLADMTQSGVNKAQNIIKPKVTSEQAIGQILQGKEGIKPAAIKTLQQVDTKGVKTFKELSTKISEKVKTLANQVDEDLAKDSSLIKLENLAIKKPTKLGDVNINYVDNGLNQLEELYRTTGDVVKEANIKALRTKAVNEGLTKLEINNLAREYGQEFGEKAFSKQTGQPLTSTNAQLFENTRSGLKDTARSGITGETAKKADELMSRLYKVDDLVRKNVEAVNKLKQRIEERNLFEKIGYQVSKYADILSGGTIRGFVGGLLPRGAGYKVLNALDLEELLERNLQIIKEAGKAKTNTQFNKKINQLFDQSLPNKASLTASATQIPKNTSNKVNISKTVTPKTGTVKKTVDKIKDALGANIPNKQGGFVKLPQRKLEKAAQQFLNKQPPAGLLADLERFVDYVRLKKNPDTPMTREMSNADFEANIRDVLRKDFKVNTDVSNAKLAEWATEVLRRAKY